jgi:transposase
MKKQFQFFVGIDVSKLKLDVCLRKLDDPDWFMHQVITNDEKGIREMIHWLKKFVIDQPVLFCIEHTGVYAMPVCCYLAKVNLDYCLVAGGLVQKSLGLKRGKNDKIDAKDIARFARMHYLELVPTQLPEKNLFRLKVLLSYRDRLLKAKKMFEVPAGETQQFIDKSIAGDMVKDSNSTVKYLMKKVEKIDQLIGKLVASDENLNQTNQLLQSIPGVGEQLATHMIVYTRCFTCFKSWRQFACYAGVAPFEYTSGSSIHGRSKVSHLANKKMKSLLHMGAIVSVKYDAEIRNFFIRKKAEGKNPMLVLNAIRNKLLSRIFAVINRGTPFVQLAKHAA